MKVKGLNGRDCTLKLHKAKHVGTDTRPRSSYHVRARAILSNVFPNEERYEEVLIPFSGGQRLDFFLPQRMLAVEVQGEQHTKFIPHFHKTKLGFLQAMERDNKKRQWCELNSIHIVELPYDESDQQWRERIENYSAERGVI